MNTRPIKTIWIEFKISGYDSAPYFAVVSQAYDEARSFHIAEPIDLVDLWCLIHALDESAEINLAPPGRAFIAPLVAMNSSRLPLQLIKDCILLNM